MMTIQMVPAKQRGDCTGCKFYRPEKKMPPLGNNRHWCTHGSYHAPTDCYDTNSIYIEVIHP